MQNTQFQQSIVRTDFTLKYYQIDELLAAHRTLKIRGVDSSVFMRSWLEFSKAREDFVIPWDSGDLDAFLKVFSQIVKDSVTDVEAFTKYLIRLQKDKPVVIAVNINDVAANQFSKLLDALKNADLSMTKAEMTDSENNSADDSKLELSGSNEALANVIVWCPNGEQSLMDYQSVLSKFPIALDVGGTAAVIQQSSKKGLYSAIGALVVVGCVGFYWQSENSGAVVQSTFEASTVSDQANISVTSNKIDESQEQSDERNAASAGLKTIQSEAGLVKIEQPLSTANDQGSSEKKAVASETVATKKEEIKAVLQGKGASSTEASLVEVSVPSAKAVVTKAVEVSASVDAKQSNLEIVEIVTTNSAPVINISSSIKTLPTSEQNISSGQEPLTRKVDVMVDAWVSAWQQQQFEGYSQHYIATFSAKKSMTHDQWLDWRRKRIERPKWIKLSRSNIKHLGPLDAGQLSITFTLTYAAPNYKDKTFKKLTLKLVGDEFKILSEENLKVTKI